MKNKKGVIIFLTIAILTVVILSIYNHFSQRTNKLEERQTAQDINVTQDNIMDEQKGIDDKGGTMRLGAYDCHIKKGSRAHEV